MTQDELIEAYLDLATLAMDIGDVTSMMGLVDLSRRAGLSVSDTAYQARITLFQAAVDSYFE